MNTFNAKINPGWLGTVCLLLISTFISSAQKSKANDGYSIAAYVWPSCHHDERFGDMLWPEGQGEWEVIKKGNPRFDGHYQPRMPLWGYEMDNNPKVVEKWIDAAVDHGVNSVKIRTQMDSILNVPLFPCVSVGWDDTPRFPAKGIKDLVHYHNTPASFAALLSNALTLDFARYSTDDGKTFSNPEPVIGIHQRLGKNGYTGKLLLKFESQVTDVPAKCSLVGEQPHLNHFSINGKEINFEGKEHYRDQSFKVQDISGTLKQGINEILLSMNYVAAQPSSLKANKRIGTEIESIYLLPHFRNHRFKS